MTELVEFLRARYDERERVARAALTSEADDGDWQTGDGSDECMVSGVSMTIYDEGGHSPEQARHIALHDPAYVLADLDAKRGILDEHHPVDPCDAHDPSLRTIPCDTQLLLALPFAGHPDYRSEWAVAK